MLPVRIMIVLAAAALATQACTDSIAPSSPSRTAASGRSGPDFTDKPPTPHVWVHYDYLVYPDGHDDAPDPAAIQQVVDVYAAHGIVLEIDNHHTAVPTSNIYLSILPDVCGALYVGDVRSQYFHPTSNHEWHYALFGERVQDLTNGAPCGAGASGWSEINGDNFVLGMELLRHSQIGNTLPAVAGAFMHELGHNLGLHHGGNEDVNYKPNYLSVMNYFFNFGIPYANALGGTTFAGYRLDYSGSALPPLDPAHLNETVGIQAGTTDIARFKIDRSDGCQGCLQGSGPAAGPIDWDLNGNATETDVAVTLYTQPPAAPLTGFDDWAEVTGYVLGTIIHGPKAIAPEDAAEQPGVSGISPSTGPAAGGTTVTITGTHLGKATQVLFGAAGPATSFQILDQKTIVAISPPYPYPTGGAAGVTVISGINPSPSVAADVFTYPAWPMPVVRSFSPTAGPLAGGTTISVNGSGFLGASAVRFGFAGAASFRVVDDTTILAVSPSNVSQSGPIGVTTLGGTGWSSSDFIEVEPPVVQGISPAAGFERGGTTVTIEVTAGSTLLVGITAVSFGAKPAVSFTQPVLDANNFGYATTTAVAPPGTGTVDVTVTDAGGTSATTAADVFTYWPTASITGLSPASGPAGTVVTISGQNLGAATGVYFGPVNAASFTVVNGSTILATAPALAAGGTVPVWVATPGGATNSIAFMLQ